MNKIRTIGIILFIMSSKLISANPNHQLTNPYSKPILVTNTILWPYNHDTYGNDSFQLGGYENEDTKLLKRALSGLHFPSDFSFGVAGSAYQYEGNRIAPNKKIPYGVGWSIWDVFSKKFSWLNPKGTNIAEVPPTSHYTYPSGKNAIKGYFPEYYKQDLKLTKNLGVQYYRLSISWPRLFPHAGMSEPDPQGVKYYLSILKQLKQHNIKPLITLYHWDLPAWLYNFGTSDINPNDRTYGWLNMREAKDNLTLKEFQKYVATCYQLFGSYTPYFSTFNEPLTFTNVAYTDGSHAPGQYGWRQLQQNNPQLYGKNFNEFLERAPYLQAINLIKAHFIAYKTIHAIYDKNKKNFIEVPKVSIVLNSDWTEPYRLQYDNKNFKYHPDDIAASKRNMDFMLGWWLHPVMFGTWPDTMQSIYTQRIKTVGLQSNRETSCLRDDGTPVACTNINNKMSPLASYIASGGALDMLAINHYTGYFAVDPKYARSHYTKKPADNAVPPDQYANSPNTLKKGWYSDQEVFTTQFRYRKFGGHGETADNNRVFVIGASGNKPWLRQTWFVYLKLLQYIDFYYLNSLEADKPLKTKMGLPFSQLAIYLTENGTSIYHESQQNSLQDLNRIQYLVGNLAAVNQAIINGINIKLYTYWSIADNFEWAEGYDSRFGLVRIDYQHDFKRELKQSYHCFKDIIQNKNAKLPKSCLLPILN